MTLQELFLKNRPEGESGKIEIALPVRIKKLHKVLQKAMASFQDKTFVLPPEQVKELSVILIEFAEDLYCGLGFWQAFEKYNSEFFNTPLPVVLEPGETIETMFSSKRIQFLLQHVYEKMEPEILIGYCHSELIELAEKVSEFLTGSFNRIPETSGIAALLAGANAEAGDVKRKLLWLGVHSYLFRLSFAEYSEGIPYDDIEINTIDDFLCARSTTLSGLGVVDILADCIDITAEERGELKSWYERHLSAYKIIKSGERDITALNIVTDQEYSIHTGAFTSQFKESNVVLGSLIPWRGDWYWSGSQQIYRDLPDEEIEDIKRIYLDKPTILYRYRKDLLQKAVAVNRIQYERFIDYYGDDIAVFPNGRELAASEKKRSRYIFEKYLSKKEQKAFIQKHNPEDGFPYYRYPEKLLNEDKGVALFYDVDEGIEIAVFFDYILSAFKKKGNNLTEDETESIAGFVKAYNLSPKFVKRMIKDYGSESIVKAFMIEKEDELVIDYLLRKYKGQFYRNRYPTLTVH